MSLPPLGQELIQRKPEPPMRSDSTKLTTVPGSPLGHTAQTLQLNRKKQSGQKVAYNSLQRHSSGNMDYDNVENCVPLKYDSANGRERRDTASGNQRTSRPLGDGLDELADMAIHSESDSVRDELSSGIRSEAEDEDSRGTRGSGRKPSLGSTPAQLSLSTTSSLSSTSTTSAARLVQSSLRSDSTGGQDRGPPQPPPRSSSNR